ncbi:trimeric intracellular cation channel family protein [Silvibacterium acidisoli]|uniref:trimeric intracellular cation channel family protein n=1 Tax=Acidobacteriaceae bacterium ZG23-2 TaxID=2883246 RepID=UPI00406D2D8E
MAGEAKSRVSLITILDFIGTYVFALEGAMTAASHGLDLLGLMVLAFATAVGGGILRDLLIGAVPPNAVRDWRYGLIAFAGAGSVFCFYPFVREIPAGLIVMLDAAGLSLFAVAGVEKALEYGIHPFIAILMGGLTGVGGGTLRDVLLAQVPAVLRTDIYAAAALFGAMIVAAGLSLKLPRLPVTICGAVFCFLLRMVSVWRHWNLPRLLH